MNIEEAFLAVVDILDELAVPYMLVSSLSSSYYGVARLTQDADFVIELGALSIGAIAKRFGQRFRLDPRMSFETVTMSRRYVADVVGTPFKIDSFCFGTIPTIRSGFAGANASASLVGGSGCRLPRTWSSPNFIGGYSVCEPKTAKTSAA